MVTIRLDGDIRALTRHIRKLENFDATGLNQALGQTLRTSTRKRFKEQRGPDDKPWKASIRVQESGGVTLTDTARLRNSIRSKADNTGFAVGTNTIYAARHQFGDKRPVTIKAKTTKGLRFRVGGRWVNKKQVKVQLPARPFLGISKDDMAEIKATLMNTIEEG